MKKITLLIAFIAFLSAASYATNTKDIDAGTPSSSLELSYLGTDPIGIIGEAKTLPNTTSCTINAIWVSSTGQKYSITVTATCTNCSVQQACDKAYQTMSIVIPN